MATLVETEITKVTVYLDRAKVTRQGTLTLDGTESILTVSHLPITVNPESIRVSGRGESAVKILGVTTERQRFKEPVKQKLAEIEAQIENLEADQRKLKARIATAEMQSEFVTGLKGRAEDTFSTSLARQKMNLSEVLGFIDNIGDKFTEYAHQIEDYRQQMLDLDKQMAVLKSQHQSFNTEKPTESLQVLVEIEAAGAGRFQLELSYTVNQANWKPLYDLRVDSTKQQLQLNYLAQITQKTGEDWTDVDLSLSTAQPGLGTLPPQLTPWYIDAQQPERLVGAAMAGAAMGASAAPVTSLRRRATAEDDYDPIEAELSVAKQEQKGTTVTFHLQGSGNIPSDGSPRKTTIARDELPCQFSYVVMPKLVAFAYLQAQIQNPSTGVTLLPGEGSVFCDDLFVGTSKLGNVAPGQDFEIYLGIEERIVIERELIERQVEKKFLGSNRRVTCAYRLKIQNLLATSAQIKLSEQVPHSRNEKIRVKLTKSDPSITVGELGLLEWKLEITAHQSRTLSYQFTIEYPEDVKVSGFNI